MENAPRLDNAVFSMLGQYQHWRDTRHLKTLVLIVVSLILSSKISRSTLEARHQALTEFMTQKISEDDAFAWFAHWSLCI